MTRDHSSPNLPAKVYVLARVSNIDCGDIDLKFYDDPHDLLSRGILRIEENSVECRLVAQEI
jgi:hypothetical protein